MTPPRDSALSTQHSALAKAVTVGTMFDGIAGRYDLMNRLMSAGQDPRWRRIAVGALAPLPPGPLLDIGVGTGDLSLALRRRFPDRDVEGLDLSAGMLAVAARKYGAAAETRAGLALGDVLRLPFADGAFAGAATAFTLRNVADLDAALAEVRRVLRPGGALAVLEITRPRGLLARPFTFYFRHVVPRVGALISGRGGAYRYLPASVDRFVSGDELQAAMRRAGFRRVRMRRFWPGAVTLHVGR
jgi:demethylmenaquinone methyltransferase / 2-methoxy-6-polyprenyl-1,4-benzoquinol methylase